MGSRPDYVRKKYGPLKDKTLQNALAHRIGTQWPKFGGDRIWRLCAEIVLEVVDEHSRPREMLQHGQVLWMAVSKDDPPKRHQRIADTDLRGVVLDLSTSEDIDSRLARRSYRERLEAKAVRLCQQAYEQGGLLSNCDVAELLDCSDSTVSSALTSHEDRTGRVVPRRATVHDVGTGLTHKRIICLKRYLEGKTPQRVARETYHSLESVDRYLGQYDRVRHCRLQGMDAAEIAYTLDCSRSLVRQYLAIDEELHEKGA